MPLLGRSLGEPIQIGLDLVILMPVAATAAIWVRDTKGDLQLLVSLVVITMSLGTLIAPTYLYYMSGLTANSIVIPRLLILRQLAIGVLLPLVVGVVLNRRCARGCRASSPTSPSRQRRPVHGGVPQRRHRVAAVAPSVARADRARHAHRARGQHRQLRPRPGIGRLAGLGRDHQVTCEFSSGMRSNGTALVVGLASFPHAPLVTVPAAIYIIFQHLLAGIVKSRLCARFGDGEEAPAAAKAAPAAATTARAA